MKIKKLILSLVLSIALCLAGVTSLMLGGCGGEHEWVNATCIAPRTCLTCGETKGEPLGHEWDQDVCGTVKNCTVCGETEANGHTVVIDASVEVTCEVPGITEGSHCSNCNAVIVAQEEIPALGHSWSNEATCENGASCASCGATQPALGHNYILTVSEATCVSAEKHAYECSICFDYYEQEIGVSKGHDIEGVKPVKISIVELCILISSYKCKECGESVSESEPYHTYKLTEVIDATCVNDGVKHFTCRYCGDEKEELILANSTGHNWVEGVVENNKRIDICSHCGESKSVTVFSETETGAVKAEGLKDTEIALDNANMSLDQGVLDATEGKDVGISAGTVAKEDLPDNVTEG